VSRGVVGDQLPVDRRSLFGGFRPPPRTILKDEFEDLCSRLPEATALLVKSYYNIDSNALSSDVSEPDPRTLADCRVTNKFQKRPNTEPKET